MNIDPEQKEILSGLYEKAKVKVFLKDKGNLLATAQVLIADLQEINGFTIWQSKFSEDLNIKPPTYDPFHKCNAIWVRDEKIWRELCKKVERQYLLKRESEETEEAINESF